MPHRRNAKRSKKVGQQQRQWILPDRNGMVGFSDQDGSRDEQDPSTPGSYLAGRKDRRRQLTPYLTHPHPILRRMRIHMESPSETNILLNFSPYPSGENSR
ncbi:hypothetical protein ABZP36_034713 [Zizania latifolia]